MGALHTEDTKPTEVAQQIPMHIKNTVFAHSYQALINSFSSPMQYKYFIFTSLSLHSVLADYD